MTFVWSDSKVVLYCYDATRLSSILFKITMLATLNAQFDLISLHCIALLLAIIFRAYFYTNLNKTIVIQTNVSFHLSPTPGYLASMRQGISTLEMEDLLSLDNEALQDTFIFHLPPDPEHIRIPNSLWSQVSIRKCFKYRLSLLQEDLHSVFQMLL